RATRHSTARVTGRSGVAGVDRAQNLRRRVRLNYTHLWQPVTSEHRQWCLGCASYVGLAEHETQNTQHQTRSRGTLSAEVSMSTTSATLLDRLKDTRDAEAWGRMNDLYAPLIRSWAERLGVRGADADDLVQNVLAVVVRRFPEFVHPERPGAFRGWLRAIAAN